MHHKYKPKSNTALTMHSYSIEIYNAFSVCTPISSHCRVYSCSLLLFIAFFFIAQSFHPFLLRKHFNCLRFSLFEIEFFQIITFMCLLFVIFLCSLVLLVLFASFFRPYHSRHVLRRSPSPRFRRSSTSALFSLLALPSVFKYRLKAAYYADYQYSTQLISYKGRYFSQYIAKPTKNATLNGCTCQAQNR